MATPVTTFKFTEQDKSGIAELQRLIGEDRGSACTAADAVRYAVKQTLEQFRKSEKKSKKKEK